MHYLNNDAAGWLRPRAHAAGRALAAAVGLAVLIQISWNMFAPELFGAPEMGIRQALGLTGVGGTLAILLRHALRGSSDV